MWQSPTSRTRAAASAKNKQNSRLRRALRLRRIEFEIRIANSDKVIAGRILVSDIDPDGGVFYSSTPIPAGSDVTFTLKDPCHFILKAHVAWSQEQTSSYKVVSINPFHFRTAVNFRFDNPEHEEAFGNICAELSGEKVAKSMIAPAAAAPAPMEASPEAPLGAETLIGVPTDVPPAEIAAEAAALPEEVAAPAEEIPLAA